ncbi:L,D-transpeptidase family protein [Devosia sp. RR2S18]|uniref:L,D-transpeptidase family protein n=1 Tax=Devosia rhizosphaerae TaxID=3049774 RepID=UPI0025404B94|nr:L,D-transpeptidase [Devosia sp. RR2S18]WIJ26622.1 L,D-transpeptidase [Devosia sp. RR2S18]
MLRSTCLVLLAGTALATPALAQSEQSSDLNLEAINTASIDTLLEDQTDGGSGPNPLIARLQILLDRAGYSPGVVDGYMGENVRKAITALELINDLPDDGELDDDVIKILQTDADIATSYTISQEDVEKVVEPLPEDYSELAARDYLGFTSVAEGIAEKFHMDIDFLKTLNPDASFEEGEEIVVTQPGDQMEGDVARIEADKQNGQVRAYDDEDNLIAAYPATVGSESNPSPSGVHTVRAIAPEPTYTYDPEVNFQQGDNTETLVLPPGPNNPVGIMWIDLSEPTYGIHGTPEPAEIDKTASHGCVRLTNWDAQELAGMVEQGVEVEFVQ